MIMLWFKGNAVYSRISLSKIGFQKIKLQQADDILFDKLINPIIKNYLINFILSNLSEKISDII